MESLFTNLENYGYLFLALYSFGGGFLALLVAGSLASLGKLDIYTVLFISFLFNFIGDNVLFYFGRYQKKEILPYFKKHKRKLALSHLLMKKHGYKIIFIQKFVYGIKTLIPVSIGLTKYNFSKFMVFNFLATIPWTLFFGIGSYLSGNILIEIYQKYFSDNNYILPIFMIIIIILILSYFHFFTKKRK